MTRTVLSIAASAALLLIGAGACSSGSDRDGIRSSSYDRTMSGSPYGSSSSSAYDKTVPGAGSGYSSGGLFSDPTGQDYRTRRGRY